MGSGVFKDYNIISSPITYIRVFPSISTSNASDSSWPAFNGFSTFFIFLAIFSVNIS
jgi:hypothetical protein